MLRPFIAQITEGRHLSEEQAAAAMAVIMQGEAAPEQIRGFLVALREKGETVDELVGFARTMRTHVLALETDDLPLIDTCGTGGDGKHTLNISTAAAITAAAAGAYVAKHGNRSVSSKCGSADLLEHWGVVLDLTPEDGSESLKANKITFMFAPRHHPAMKHAAGPRRELGVRTVFNLLGPMTNPAGVKRQVMGVFDRQWTAPLAQALMGLGADHVLVVASEDGLDEISPSAPTQVSEGKDGHVETYVIEPATFGLERQALKSIVGGEVTENADRLSRVLQGQDDPAATAVIINTAAALYVAGSVKSLHDGAVLARNTLKTGAPWETTNGWAKWTQTRK